MQLQGQGVPPLEVPPLVVPIVPAPEPTLRDIMAAQERSAALAAENARALQAQIHRLQTEMATRPVYREGLQAYGTVHGLPLHHSKSGFTTYTLKNLPVDVDALQAGPAPLLQTADNSFVRAIEARKTNKYNPDLRQPQVQDGITISLSKEINPLLTIQAIGELSADVHRALQAAQGADEINIPDLLAAVNTAAYLAAWSQKLVDTRVGEIAATLQYDQETAQKWAAQCYGTQNTLMGDSPAAAAFQLAKASEPKTAVPVVAIPSAWPKTYKGSGGQGRGRAAGRGGRNTPRAEQVSGPGADRAPGRPQ
jgi:hypothetical protein